MDAIDRIAEAPRRPAAITPPTAATTFRFFLLAAAATAAVAAIANWLLPSVFGAYGNDDVLAYNACQQAVYEDMIGIARANDGWDVLRDDGPLHQRLDDECAVPATSLIWPVVGAVVFWATVFGVLGWLPAWRIRRRRYETLCRVAAGETRECGEEDAERFNLLAALQEKAGIASTVTYLQDSLDFRCSALAFGRIGHRCVVLSNGLETLRSREPEHFETIVLHELAHLRNRDIDVGFLTVIAWRVAMPLVTGACVLTALGALNDLTRSAIDFFYSVAVALQYLVLAVVVLLLRNSVLRSRELAADAWVSRWKPGSVGAVLDAYFPKESKRPRALWTHPSPKRRRDSLSDPSIAAATSFWVWFATGLVTKILMVNIASASGPVWGTSGEHIFAVGAAIVLAAFAIEISLGRDATTHTRDERLIGFGLGLGLAVGFVLFEPGSVMISMLARDLFAVQYLLWIPLLSGAAWLAYRWLGAVARAWEPVLATRRQRWSIWLCRSVLGLSIVPVYVGLKFLVTLPTQAVVAPLVDTEGILSALALVAELAIRFVWFSYTDTGPMLLVLAVLPLIAESILHDRRLIAGLPWRRRRRLRTGLRQGLFKGVWYGLAAVPVSLVAVLLMGSRFMDSLAYLATVYTIVGAVAVLCAAHLGYGSAHRPHPVASAALGALTSGCVYVLFLVLLALGDTESIDSTVESSWFPVPAGVAVGAGAGALAARLGRRRPDPSKAESQVRTARTAFDDRASVERGGAPSIGAELLGIADLYRAGAAEDQRFQPWRHVRTGLLYGAIGSVVLFIGLCAYALSVLMVGPAIQVWCAVRVARKEAGRPHPVRAAAIASATAGGAAHVLATVPMLALLWPAGEPLQGTVTWLTTSICPLLVGTGIAVLVASAAASARRRSP